MCDYPYPSYIPAVSYAVDTGPSTHQTSLPVMDTMPQHNRSLHNTVVNSVSRDAYGSSNPQIPYQPSIKFHNSGAFQLNPNAAPFYPSLYQRQEISPFANVAVYNGYCSPSAYDYQFGEEQAPASLFTSFMDHTAPNDNGIVENHGVELRYGSTYGYYGQQITLSPMLCQRMMYSERAKELQEIQVGLEQLILEPGEFETWSNAIRERTTNPSFKVDALKIVVEMIIQMAALTSTSQTVQYNLAKLCSLICHDLDAFQDDMINSLLCFHEKQRCSLGDEQRKNLLLFFAEVYEKLEAKRSLHMKALEQALLEQMKEILLTDHLNDAKVKVVVEVLKLTGRYLDADQGCLRINELLTQLNAIAKAHPAISDAVKERILSLNTWRENNWNARNFSINREEKLPSEQNRKENESGLTASCSSSFIIGPDGQPLTDEEKAFLDENFVKLVSNDATMDNDDVSDEYDEFLSTVDNEEARKCVAEIEVAEMEKQLARTRLSGLDQGQSATEDDDKELAV